HRVRTDMIAPATAALDSDIVGFRPLASQLLPLAPLALYSDPTGTARQSWEYQVEKGKGPDNWRYDRDNRRLVAESDGLHEMNAQLVLAGGAQGQGGKTDTALSNVSLLQFGAADLSALAKQLSQGVGAADLAALGGLFLLPPTNQLPVP